MRVNTHNSSSDEQDDKGKESVEANNRNDKSKRKEKVRNRLHSLNREDD